MKRRIVVVLFAVVIGLMPVITGANEDGLLQGDTRLACEALLCLSSGQVPGQCGPSLSRYFGIVCEKPWETLQARRNFLNLCPQSNQTPAMSQLTTAIAYGAGRCDAVSLNKMIIPDPKRDLVFFISDKMPGYCQAYVNHEFTDLAETTPRYVGIPERGGRWVEAKDYDAALKAYNARIEKEDYEKKQKLKMFIGFGF